MCLFTLKSSVLVSVQIYRSLHFPKWTHIVASRLPLESLDCLCSGDTAGKRYLDSGASDNDADQSSLGFQQGTQYLNSLDPYPELRRLTGPSRSLLKRYYLLKTYQSPYQRTIPLWFLARIRFTTSSELLATRRHTPHSKWWLDFYLRLVSFPVNSQTSLQLVLHGPAHAGEAFPC